MDIWKTDFTTLDWEELLLTATFLRSFLEYTYEVEGMILTPVERRLMTLLLRRRGKLTPTQMLIDYSGSTAATVKVMIARLKKRVAPQFKITTYPRLGYVLENEAT